SEVHKFLAERCPLSEVRRIGEEQSGFCIKLWREISELGWAGLTIAETHGGAGLSWLDLVVLLEEAGRQLLPLPLLSTSVAAHAIAEAGSERQQAEWLPRLASGEQIATLAVYEEDDAIEPERIKLRASPQGDGSWRLDGAKIFVPDAPNATLFVVAVRTSDGGDGGDEGDEGDEAVRFAVVPVGTPGVEVEAFPTMDLTKPMGAVRFDCVEIGAEMMLQPDVSSSGSAHADIYKRVIARATTALCAEMSGAAEANLQLAIDYAKERVQFGSPIGRYQGVKHPLAEMYQALESFKSLLYYAAWALDERPDEALRYASMAKAQGSDCCARIGIDAIQIHGAVGYTWEYDPQLYLKRSKWSRAMYGNANHHYDEIARMGGL
ncbi:MAG: acyl-CoA/acyl-ACP dehydrogenase, partial [Deltaproteobacteria bacterium]|nr:acyl-CoA/acyl-ACP dehydrogenase [Deltaproteobacteria bacterium]